MNTTTLFRTARVPAGWTDPWGVAHEVEVVTELVHVELVPGLTIKRNDGYQICSDPVWQDARGQRYVQQRNRIDYSGGCSWRTLATTGAASRYYLDASASINQKKRTVISIKPVTVQSLIDHEEILPTPSFV